MMRSLRLAGMALALGVLVAAAPAAQSDDPHAYAMRIPIVVGSGSTVQRLAIPAAALAASRTANLADVRVFDAADRPMPIARVAPAAGPAQRYDLVTLPILGAADALTITGVSLRLDGEGHARATQIDGTPAGRPTDSVILGALLDARAIKQSARALLLDADMPEAQPVTFTVEASADLKDWRPLAEQIVYRTPGHTPPRLNLGDAALEDEYIRITWRAASRLLAPVTVRKATLLTRPPAAAAVSIAASLPPLGDAHAAEFAMPSASALDTIQIVPTGTDMIIPVRIFGRDDRERSWTLLGTGTAVAVTTSATATRSIALNGGRYRMIRIEADARSSGFTSPPLIHLGFSPRAILFVAAGKPPYILASGRAGATDLYLPAETVMTQASNGSVSSATVRAPQGTLQLAAVSDANALRRQMLLWTILLVATALLAAMAWRVWKHGIASRAGPNS